jgi:hypothetical protein
MSPAETAQTKLMTFTVRDVRAVKHGTTASGRQWTRYLITTLAGEKIGTFEGAWQLFVGDTMSTEVAETLIDGRVYLGVGKPPGAASSPSTRRTAQTASATDPEVRHALRRIELRLSEVIARLDAMTTSPRADPDGETNGAE